MKDSSCKITENVKTFLKKYELCNKNQTLLVGFSGGSDSLCLLDVLYKLGLTIIAAHLNHNWRPEEARLEEERAGKYCRERNIEFYSETLPTGLPQTEEEARNQRYRFFNRIAEKSNATAILTGHTSTDNVETILYRIIKGTGISGLKGIPEIRKQEEDPAIYRPLLGLTREDCIAYCEENSLSPSIDSSNLNQKYARNRIRLSLLPELRTYNPEVDQALLRLSEIAKEADTVGIEKRNILHFLAENNIEYSYKRINDLYNFIEENKTSKSGKTFSIGKEQWVFVSSKEMKLINKQPPAALPELKITEWTGGMPEKFPDEKSRTIYADLSSVKGDLSLRKRKPGDIIQPFGMKEKTKLKKYLINRGIPQHERDNISLLVNDEEVLWVVGIGISEMLRVKTTPTHVIEVIPLK